MNNQEKDLIRILDRIQIGGSNASSDDTSGSIANIKIAEYLIRNRVHVHPIAIGDRIYVVCTEKFPCDRCDHYTCNEGCCMFKCPDPVSKIDTKIVDDVTQYCYLNIDGEVVLKKGVYLTASEAYAAIAEPMSGNKTGECQLEKSDQSTRLTDLDDKIIIIRIRDMIQLDAVIKYLISVGITHLGTGGTHISALLTNLLGKSFIKGDYLTINRKRINVDFDFVSVGGAASLGLHLDFEDLNWEVQC